MWFSAERQNRTADGNNVQAERLSWFPHIFGEGYFWFRDQQLIFPISHPTQYPPSILCGSEPSQHILVATQSGLLANHSITSLRCISQGAAKMGHRRATAPRRHLFQGNTPSRAKGEQAGVSGALSQSSNMALKDLLHPLQHQLTVPNWPFLQPSPPGLCRHPNYPKAESPSHSKQLRGISCEARQYCTDKRCLNIPTALPRKSLLAHMLFQSAPTAIQQIIPISLGKDAASSSFH